MHFVYIDDSKDDKLACFSALAIPAHTWAQGLNHLIEARRAIRASDEVFLRKEIHATDWLGGKGRVSPRFLPKPARVRIYNFLLSSIVLLRDVQVFNAAVPKKQEERAFEWLLNRINVNMRKASSEAVLFCDQGKSYDKLFRRMRKFNYIPSQFGKWEDGSAAKNLVLDRILEDIIYRDSERSLFVQAADWCAYALLRRENPVESKTKLGLDKSFETLAPVLCTAANRKDPHGIIR